MMCVEFNAMMRHVRKGTKRRNSVEGAIQARSVVLWEKVKALSAIIALLPDRTIGI